MWDFLDSVERSDVVEGVNAGRQPAVQAENLVVDECSEGEIVEEVGEVFPDISIAVFSQTFVVKAIDLGNLSTLVVPSKDGDSGRVSDLQGDKEGHRLDGVVATIYVVSCYAVSGRFIRLFIFPFCIPIKR